MFHLISTNLVETFKMKSLKNLCWVSVRIAHDIMWNYIRFDLIFVSKFIFYWILFKKTKLYTYHFKKYKILASIQVIFLHCSHWRKYIDSRYDLNTKMQKCFRSLKLKLHRISQDHYHHRLCKGWSKFSNIFSVQSIWTSRTVKRVHYG